jgi:3',5'-cyclic-AMP phosphodiesterase
MIGAKSKVRLTHLTDPHLYGGEGELLRGIATLPSLEATLAHAQQRDWPPDAVLVTGDLVQDDPAGYAHFRRVFGSLRLPVLCLPGNHDEPEAMRRELTGAPFVVGGAVDLGLWRIVLLDSTVPGSAAGRLSADSLADLQSALAGAAQRHALVCLHHHPVPMGSRWLDRVGLQNAAEFFEVIDRHPNVRGIVWGHVHQSYDALRNGVRLLATPSTCAQFLPRSEQFAIDPRSPAYRTLELEADGSIRTDLVWVEGGAGSASKSAWAAA